MHHTLEAAIKYVQDNRPATAKFSLDIALGATFLGRPDPAGAGFAVLLSELLGLGYMPDGVEDGPGFRRYRYVLD